MNKSVIKPVLSALMAVALFACEKEEPEVAAPMFERQPHVEHCLPALLALDTLANDAAGTQVGQRVAKAPWLRLDSELVANRDNVPLTDKSLGPVIMPMLFKAQAGLKAEIASIDEADVASWAEAHGISQPAESFMEYCSREAAFAQWRDYENTIPWLKGLVLQAPNRGWFASWLTRSESPDTVEASPVAWQRFVPSLPGAERVSLSADANGVKRVAQKSEMPLLVRYAPAWSLPETSSAKLVGLTWDGVVEGKDEPQSYAYISYATALSQRLIRLNYVTWWQLEDDSLHGMLYRMTITQRGKPVAVDVLNLDGSAYQLFIQNGFEVSGLPEQLTATSMKLMPKMTVFLNDEVSAVIRVGSGGSGESTPYSMAEFADLMTLGAGTARHSAFDKDGVLDVTQSYRRLFSWLTGVPKVGLPRKPETIVLDGQQLAFEDPNLLSGFQLTPSK